MSSTFDRMRVILMEIENNDQRQQKLGPDELATEINERKLAKLTIERFDQNTKERIPTSLSEKSILYYFTLLDMLKLASLSTNDISIRRNGSLALEGDKYRYVITESVFDLLNSLGVNKADLFTAMDKIKPPNFPSAENIYAEFADAEINRNTLDLDLFRRLMYLLACAGGIEREVSVYYGR